MHVVRLLRRIGIRGTWAPRAPYELRTERDAHARAAVIQLPTAHQAKPRRPALRYHGGKWLVADWIIRHFPPHEHYVEPFGGGAAVLLQKPRSALETYNDISGEVVNFFRVLREQPDELVRQLELTPWSREEYVAARFADLAELPPLEAARRFFVRSWQAIGVGMGRTDAKNLWRYEKRVTWKPSCVLWSEPGRLEHLFEVAGRLRGVQLEHDDAYAILKRYDSPNTLFYLDPPYLAATLSTGHGRAAYAHVLSEAQHRLLCHCARGLEGYVVLSGYRSTLYERFLERYGWTRVETQRELSTGRSGSRIECLWLSPRTVAALSGQLFSPFADGNGGRQ
jgi:DNA adenine methylase